MNIKNYTSGIPVETTVSRIEAKLQACGASGIMKLYNNQKQVCALVFHIDINGRNISIRVPANAEDCFQSMWKDHQLKHSRIHPGTEKTIREQANRTSWRLVQDWIDVQISMIVMKQAEFLQVFLPYVWDGKQTYFEAVKGGGFKALPERVE